MSDEIRVGIIGNGQIGTYHLQQYQKIPGAKVVALCDIVEEKAEKLAAEFSVPRTFKWFRELLKMDEIDAVDVCVHNNLHAPIAIAALEAGKHVYCEKPLAGSYFDAAQMVQTARRVGRKLYMQVGTIFSPETRAAKRLIDDGCLGRLYYAKSSGYRRRGRPFVDGYGSQFFVQKPIAAGGAVFDMGVYHITQILYLLGNPEVLTVSGATHQEIDMYEDRRRESQYSVEELGVGLVRLAGGITLLVEEAWAIHLGGSDGCKIAGAKGGVTLHPFAFHTTLADMEMNATFELGEVETRYGRCFPEHAAFQSPQHHWIAALRGQTALIQTAEIGVNTMLISEGIYISQGLGREVTAEEVRRLSTSTAVKGL